MSLVAYGNSSDEDSDEYDSSEEANESNHTTGNHASLDSKENTTSIDANIGPALALKLPTPKGGTHSDIIEEDDEFLHKKAIAPSEKPPQPVKRSTVKITIPALQKKDEREKFSKKCIGAEPNKPTGLLNLLPKPAFSSFVKKSIPAPGNKTTDSSPVISKKETKSLIPHSVAKNVANAKKSDKKLLPIITDENSGSDSSDNDDFFSFHSEHKLPEVSQHEINAMVEKKAAEMKTATISYLKSMDRPTEKESEPTVEISEQSQIDEEALRALCGSSAKRARRGEAHNVVIELSDDQVLPNRDEWLRNQLQSATEYQPRGLVDEEPAAGTRKKHQITYLAHQAKANEQELQAMWAENRHTRRQTQNKYGF